MSKIFDVTDTVKYIGVDDKEMDLFENQYILKNGISYNSYLINDEKIVVMDTVDRRKTDEWLHNLEEALNGRKPDYLVISHLEPDHSGSIGNILKKYPEMKIISNEKVFTMLPQFIDDNIEERKVVVKEGDCINTGKHNLTFVMAPMVHWPEVMMTYDKTDKILFSADAFGKFGTLDTKEEWIDEARRYFLNIVGKYGMQVQNVLKKASSLEINIICSLHGPILKENLEYYIGKYDTWSKYEPEDEGVFIACSSIYGNTLNAVKEMKKMLEEKGIEKVVLTDLTTEDWAEAVEDAFRYSHMIVASSSYNTGLFPPMKQFLDRLQERNYQNRTVGIIENGSWAPSAGKCMKEMLQNMKNINIIEPTITIKSRMNEENRKQMSEMAEKM